MPPKTVFSTNDDKIITEIFDMRIESGWSNIETERQFQHKTNRRLSYKTLYARYNVLISVSRNVNDQLFNVQPGTSSSFATQVVLNDEQPIGTQHEYSLEQTMVAINHQEAVADITNEFEQGFSLQDEDETINPNLNTMPIQRRRGRPVGSVRRRKRTPLTIQETIRRLNRKHPIRRIQSENPRIDRQIQIVNSSPNESDNLIITRNLRERIGRRNQTAEVTAVQTDSQNAMAQQTPIVAENNSSISRSIRYRFRRANESPRLQRIRLNTDAKQHRDRRANETPEEHERRLQYQRDYRARVRENETPDERMERLRLVNEKRRILGVTKR